MNDQADTTEAKASPTPSEYEQAILNAVAAAGEPVDPLRAIRDAREALGKAGRLLGYKQAHERLVAAGHLVLSGHDRQGPLYAAPGLPRGPLSLKVGEADYVEVRATDASVVLELSEDYGDGPPIVLGQVHLPRDRDVLGQVIAYLVAEKARVERGVAACTGHRYLVNPDHADEGYDIHHDRPCPVHLPMEAGR